MFKKLIFLLTILVIATAVGATIYLNMIDWNEHKAVIAKQFSEATGKEIEFKGTVIFNILPSPSLEASDIEIYNKNADGKKISLAKIQKLVASLSIRSLLKGNINVEKMKVVNPEIFIEQFEDGKLNWQSSHGNNQDFSINNVEISLDSVMLDNAKIHLINQTKDFNALITDINAEVIAGSLFGPYRIEGSYIKNENPGGFAIDLGQFSEGFATSVNAVISHPQSESYARFDGTVLLNNDAVNGNITIESKNPVNFVNSLFKSDISEDYEYPLAMSLAIKTDKKQISLSNVVIKYADSAGAGNMIIPRIKTKIIDTGEERLRIDVAFNMAEFNPEPMFQLIKDFWKKYDGKDYIPELDFDIIADIKSVKTTYKNQDIRDFDLSIDLMDNVITVQHLDAQLPFDGSLKMKGEVFSKEKVLTYNFDIDATTPEFAKTVQWLGYDLNPLSKNVYKRASTKFNVSGTQQTIKVAPFVFNVDKTGINGKLAMIRGDQNKYFAILESDNINFDNYIADMPQEVVDGDFENKMAYRFKQLDFLQNLDLQYRINLASGIWGKVPFDKLYAEGTLKEGILKINEFSVGDIATAEIAAKGEVSGFGTSPQVKNLKYGIAIKNNRSFLEKMKLSFDFINFDNLNQFDSKGVITGGPSRMAVKTSSRLGNISNVYNGEISKIDGIYNLNGKLEINSNDAIKTLNDFSVRYRPDYPLGLLKLAADIQGSVNTFVLRNMNLNIGTNTFTGDFLYSNGEESNLIKTNLNINKFEFEKFFYNKNARGENTSFHTQSEKVPFFAKPILSRIKFNYDWAKDLEIEAKINTETVSLNNLSMQNASWFMSLKQNVLKIAEFTATKNKGTITFNGELNIPEQQKLSGSLKVADFEIEKNKWTGLTYGIRSGVLNGEFNFDTQASSADEMFSNLSGNGSFTVDKPVIKGWNLSVIEADLEKRERAEGLESMVNDNLSHGDTMFHNLTGTVELDKGHFDFNKVKFSDDTYSVETTAYGSVNEWTMNAVNKLAFVDMPNIRGFDFVLEGSISAPTLTADVSAISNMYTEHLEKLAAEAKAVNDARIAKYRALMDVQQELAQKSHERLQKTVIPLFKSLLSKSEDDKMKQSYNAINKRLAKALTDIKKVMSYNTMTDIDDEIISNLQKANNNIEQDILDIENDMALIHAQDVRIRINRYYDALVEQSMELPDLSTAINGSNGDYGKRLAAIDTEYSIESDQVARGMQQKIDNYIAEIDAINQRTAEDNISAKGILEVEMLENYASDFKKSYQTVSSNMQNIKKIIKDYNERLEEIVSKEEETYKQRKAEEELRQKISENTGKIVTDSKTVTVERNLDEIERSEELIKRQDGKIINFSKDGVVVRDSSSSSANTTRDEEPSFILKIEEDEEIESGGRILK